MIDKTTLIAAAASAGMLVGVWVHGSSHGRMKCEQAATQAVMSHQRGMIELADELEAEKAKKAKVVIQKVEVIRHVPDPSGCADSVIIPGILERLH